MEAGALTGLTVGGGCAAKYSAARLDELLKGFAPLEAENLLVGLSPADDAAVYKLDAERALVFTLDFFPPLVDDPATFGRIAATNALNDVFAMGGSPLLALSIAAFPEELPNEVLAAVFAAADEQVRAAGALLAGGHTIRDTEPKYGLAVVGTVHPGGIWTKSGARPGDALFLTKPLGTGLVLAAKGDLEEAVGWMTTLNGTAAAALRPFAPNAVTDVTGFGLFGHAHELAERSGVHV
ncbi:MAG: selenide, water dikinase SelD, partial [Gaiellaceae bacterium]